MAKIVVSAGRNEVQDTYRAIDRAKDGDTIVVPNEKCAAIARKADKFILVDVKDK